MTFNLETSQERIMNTKNLKSPDLFSLTSVIILSLLMVFSTTAWADGRVTRSSRVYSHEDLNSRNANRNAGRRVKYLKSRANQASDRNAVRSSGNRAVNNNNSRRQNVRNERRRTRDNDHQLTRVNRTKTVYRSNDRPRRAKNHTWKVDRHRHGNNVIYRNVYRYRPYAYRSRINWYIPLTFAGINYYFNNGSYYRYNGFRFTLVHGNVGTYIYSLPYGYRTVYVGNYPYYFANDRYYIRDHVRNVYLQVEDPYETGSIGEDIADASEYHQLFIYPVQGQTEEQKNQDEYECHLWAVDQTGFDPSLGKPGNIEDYQRAQTACLEGRGYVVN